jgi:hypothetical protein
MEDTYYFSQGRFAYSGVYAKTYNKFQNTAKDIETGFTKNIVEDIEKGYTRDLDKDISNNAKNNGILSKLWNFRLYNKNTK